MSEYGHRNVKDLRAPWWPEYELPHALVVAVLTVLAVPIFFWNLGEYGLVNADEGVYHWMSRHMVETGDWFTLEFAGTSRLYEVFTHAPLFMWLKAVVLLAVGDSYWSMRGISALAALLAVVATYALALRVVERRFALLAAVLHMTGFQFVYLHSGRTQ